MTYQRLAYDDAATTSEMLTDASAVGRELHLPAPRPEGLERHRDPASLPATPVVTDDLARVAAGLELHFD